jgi:hypothetical protein
MWHDARFAFPMIDHADEAVLQGADEDDDTDVVEIDQPQRLGRAAGVVLGDLMMKQ